MSTALLTPISSTDGTGEITLEMTGGAYVLICNIVEDEAGETESHYLNGMRTAFTVE